MNWKRITKWSALLGAALMLSTIVLAYGVNVVAAAPGDIVLENIQIRNGPNWGSGTDAPDWLFTYHMQSLPATEGDAITALSIHPIDYIAGGDPASRSRYSMEVKQDGVTVYSWTPTLQWYWSPDLQFWYALPQVEVNIPIPEDKTTTIITTMEIYSDGAWAVDTIWTNYIGEAEPIIYGDYLMNVLLEFNAGQMQVFNGNTVKVRENGTLSGVHATGMIGNGSKPIIYYDQTTSYLDVSLVDYKGNVVYSDIVWEMNKQQMPDSYYWRVEYGYMDIVQELLRFNEAYTIQIEMYTINEDWMTFTVHDRWTIYLDNEYVYTPPEDEQGAVIYGALGFIGVIGFIGSPMLMAAMMRRGMESYRAIPYLLMLMVASGVLAYVFLLGGD